MSRPPNPSQDVHPGTAEENVRAEATCDVVGALAPVEYDLESEAWPDQCVAASLTQQCLPGS